MRQSLVTFGFVLATAALCLVQSSARDEATVWAAEVPASDAAIDAATTLRDVIVSQRLFPAVPKHCFAFELEAAAQDSFDFAAKFNGEICKGTSKSYSSNLLDRFRVMSRTGEILWFDAAEPEAFKSLDARQALRR